MEQLIDAALHILGVLAVFQADQGCDQIVIWGQGLFGHSFFVEQKIA